MPLPEIVSREQWRAARAELRAKEEAVLRARAALGEARRGLPVGEVGAEYLFEGGDGKATLLDLFEGRPQLIVHHFEFAPEWEAGRPESGVLLDQVGHLAHLHARATSFTVVSRAPFTKVLPFKARMGWTLPWVSSYGNDFNRDFEATVERDGLLVERQGVSCFLREGDRVFHTYSLFDDVLDTLGSTPALLDLTPLGRSPEGSDRLRHHDEYGH